jgi:hypothetical protein
MPRIIGYFWKDYMKKAFILIPCILIIVNVFAKETLAILPFSGGHSDEGVVISELFANNTQLNDYFEILFRTDISRAVDYEQFFQMNSGMTNQDTIISIGRQLGAKYIVAGSITVVGNNKLVVISVLDITTLQMIAGDYQSYSSIREMRGKLPNMAENIILATLDSVHPLQKLAIVPVQMENVTDIRTADTLAQILAINLIRTRKYSIYPRTSSLEQVRNEYNTQLSGVTADENVVDIGRGENPELVLSVVARKLESDTMFIAAILNLLTGISVRSAPPVDYRDISDGIRAMETLAIFLTGSINEINNRQRHDTWVAFITDEARFWSIGASVGSSFADPWIIGTIHFTLAPFRYSFLLIGLDAGFITVLEETNYYSLTPFAQYSFFLPFDNFAWYIGAGFGYMIAEYELLERMLSKNIFIADFTTGINFFKYFNISYTLRTDFNSVSNKISAGVTYRF